MSIKGLFTDEANAEAIAFLNSKSQYISLNGINMRVSTNEAIQTLYSLTNVLSDMKLTNPVF